MREPATVVVEFLMLAQYGTVNQKPMAERAAKDDARRRARRLVLGELPRQRNSRAGAHERRCLLPLCRSNEVDRAALVIVPPAPPVRQPGHPLIELLFGDAALVRGRVALDRGLSGRLTGGLPGECDPAARDQRNGETDESLSGGHVALLFWACRFQNPLTIPRRTAIRMSRLTMCAITSSCGAG